MLNYSREDVVRRYPDLFLHRESYLDMWYEVYSRHIDRVLSSKKITHVRELRKIGSMEEDYLEVKTILVSVESYFKSKLAKIERDTYKVLLGVCHARAKLVSMLIEELLHLRTHVGYALDHTEVFVKLEESWYRLTSTDIIETKLVDLVEVLEKTLESDVGHSCLKASPDLACYSIDVIEPGEEDHVRQLEHYLVDWSTLVLDVLHKSKKRIDSYDIWRECKSEEMKSVYEHYHDMDKLMIHDAISRIS